MKAKLFLAVQAAWYRGAPWLWLLVPLAWCYRAATASRRVLYSTGVLPVYRASCPVAVVGNLCVGGTGKTPTVLALVEALAQRGIRAGVVSRGYGRRNGAALHRLGALSTVAECGDEMLMVFQRTGAPCAVAGRRALAVAALADSGEVDIILSDDGLQHYALARDYEIILYDAQAGFGNGRCLPAGPLREPRQRLRTADVVLSRGEQPAADAIALVPECLVNVCTGEHRPLAAHGLDSEVVAIAGVGQPGLFFQQLAGLGFRAREHRFPDHHMYTATDLAIAKGQPLIMTEKDAVKCRPLKPGNAWYLKTNAVVPPSVINAVAALVATSCTAPE